MISLKKDMPWIINLISTSYPFQQLILLELSACVLYIFVSDKYVRDKALNFSLKKKSLLDIEAIIILDIKDILRMSF